MPAKVFEGICGPMEATIRQRLEAELKPTHLEIINESHLHTRGQQTHFKIIIVSEQFANLSKAKRQQLVYQFLSDLFRNGLHSLNQATFTPQEWEKSSTTQDSPSCMTMKKRRSSIF